MKAKTYVKSMKNYGIKSNNSDNYNEKYIKIKINSDDDLPLKKTLELHNMIIVVRSVFHEDSKYYRQFFFFRCYILIELTVLKVLMLIRQRHQRSVLFVPIIIF